jgi:hypothetical protein
VDDASLLPVMIPSNVRVVNRSSAGISVYENQRMFSAYPSPCSDQINISVQSEQIAEISVDLFDIYGVKVRNLVSKQSFNAGISEMQARIDDVNPGVYFCRIQMNDNMFSRMILVLK